MIPKRTDSSPNGQIGIPSSPENSFNSQTNGHIPLYQRTSLNTNDSNISDANTSYESYNYDYTDSLQLFLEPYTPIIINKSPLSMGEKEVSYVNGQSWAPLLSSNLYQDDFYYLKMKSKENPNDVGFLSSPLPPTQNKYFQNSVIDFKYVSEKRLATFSKSNSSLGVPHAINIYQPRKVLDLDAIEGNGFKDLSWELRRQVESGFSALLLLTDYTEENIKKYNEIDQADARKQKDYCYKQLLYCFGFLNNLEDINVGWLCRLTSLIKGRQLLIRALPFFQESHKKILFRVFYSNLPFFFIQSTMETTGNWVRSNHEFMSKMSEAFSLLAYGIDFYCAVLSLICKYEKPVCQFLITNENCSTLFAQLLSQAEAAPGEGEKQSEYKQLFKEVGNLLNSS